MSELRYFDSFAGVGGFSIGIERAVDNQYEPSQFHQTDSKVWGERNTDEQNNGVRTPNHSALCVGFSEIDKYASQVLKYRYPNVKNYGDITLINPTDLPDFDLFTGGFPCQSFSIAGLRRGFDDTRGTLFFEIARILAHKRPRYFLLENVKGLLSHDSGKTFQTILKVLTDLGYDTQWACINAKNFGVPQNRERIFFAGCLGGWGGREVFSFGKNDSVPVKRQGEVSPTITQRYYKQGQSDPYIVTEKSESSESSVRQTGNQSNSPDSRGGQTHPADNNIKQITHPKHSQQRVYDPNGIAPTIAAGNLGGGKSPSKIISNNKLRIRRLTPRECEALMSWERDWTRRGLNEKGETVEMSDTRRYKACGNGVVSNCVQAIIENIIFPTPSPQ